MKVFLLFYICGLSLLALIELRSISRSRRLLADLSKDTGGAE